MNLSATDFDLSSTGVGGGISSIGISDICESFVVDGCKGRTVRWSSDFYPKMLAAADRPFRLTETRVELKGQNPRLTLFGFSVERRGRPH
jgi:hypothetical protein